MPFDDDGYEDLTYEDAEGAADFGGGFEEGLEDDL